MSVRRACIMRKRWAGFIFFLLACHSQAEEPALIGLKPVSGMTRADLYYIKTVQSPRAVLALCPGCNGNGKGLVSDPVWQAFAKKQNLGLVGLSFASELKDLYNGKGYYYPHNGSGKILLNGIYKLFNRKLPLILYGFSGGAHFTSRFVEWKPERVIAWCAYSAGWWDKPKTADIMPPGIVACGEEDERLGASFIYFKEGRALGKPWLWIGIPHNSHSPHRKVETFARDYFEAILENQGKIDPTKTGLWVDIDKQSAAESWVIREYPSVTAWLPDVELLDSWRLLNAGK